MNSPSLNVVLRLIRAQSHLQNRFAAALGGVHGLSLNELMLLMHLDQAAGGRLRRVDLAERLEMSQSGVTRMLAPMEKVGWVARAEDVRDGRVSYVELRKAGRRLAREGANTLAAQAESLLAGEWTAQDLDLLARLLGRLTATLPGQLTA
ncbi:MAG TPA: MarR family transcriptional regulator [Steroidobacteraceae bacterium]|nr:MarR family transcriptional regulator [Steroidobacteraceae bacterium]